MKAIIFATLLSLFSFSNTKTILTPQGVGVEWVQGRSSVRLQADFNETIEYQFINTAGHTVIAASFEAPADEVISTTQLATGYYTIHCYYTSGSDMFEVFIDND